MRGNTGIPPIAYTRTLLLDVRGVSPKQGSSNFLRLTNSTYKTIFISNSLGELFITTLGAGAAVTKITTTINMLEYSSAAVTIQSTGGGTTSLTLGFDSIKPPSAAGSSLGASALYWDDLYVETIWGAGCVRYVVDNTDTAIQAAVDAVEAAGGGTVVLPAATYPISTKILIDANVPLRFIGYGAILEAQAALDFIIHVDRVNGSTSEFCTIQGITLDGNNIANVSALRIEDTDRVVVKEVFIKDCSNSGIGLDLYAGANAGSTLSWVEGCHFENMWVSNCVTGVQFNRGAQGDYTSFFENIFTNVGVQNCTTGWLIDRWANLTRCRFINTVTWIGDNQTGWDIRGDMKEVVADLHIESSDVTPVGLIGITIGANAANLIRWTPHYSFVGSFTTKISDSSTLLYPKIVHLETNGWHTLLNATLGRSGTGGGDYTYYLFPAAGWSGISGIVPLPSDFAEDGLLIAILLFWTSDDTNGAHKVRWGVRTASLTVGDLATLSAGAAFAQNDSSILVSGTAHQVQETYFYQTAMTGIARGDWLKIVILREGDHADDDATEARLLGAAIAYKRNT